MSSKKGSTKTMSLAQKQCIQEKYFFFESGFGNSLP